MGDKTAEVQTEVLEAVEQGLQPVTAVPSTAAVEKKKQAPASKGKSKRIVVAMADGTRGKLAFLDKNVESMRRPTALLLDALVLSGKQHARFFSKKRSDPNKKRRKRRTHRHRKNRN